MQPCVLGPSQSPDLMLFELKLFAWKLARDSGLQYTYMWRLQGYVHMCLESFIVQKIHNYSRSTHEDTVNIGDTSYSV